MKPYAYSLLAAVDKRHWWHVSRRRLAALALRRTGFTHGRLGLDLGCGPGGDLPFLSQWCDVAVGVDLSDMALGLAGTKVPGARLVRADANGVGHVFRPDSFDLVTDFNVMYHQWIEDEVQVMRGVRRILRPGGLFLATEPAYECLRRGHDDLAMGARRYTMSRLKGMVAEAGLDWAWASYFNAPCLPPALALAVLDRLRPAASRDEHEGGGELAMPAGFVNAAMQGALTAERLLIGLLGGIPLGLTAMFVARKPLDTARRSDP